MSEIINSTYEIIGKLGSGGGGIVYLANHMRLGKKVVLKADKRNADTRAELLRREVDVLKELHHAYIPQVYDYFIEDGISYTVMDYVDGESLDSLMKRNGRFTQPEIIKWAKQLLEALAYLHSPTHGDPPHGFLHSDIKPANIMLRPNGDICLIDFNISLALGIENIVGKSEGYSSPEYYDMNFPLLRSANGNDTTKLISDDDQDDKTVLLYNDTDTDKTEIIRPVTTDNEAAVSTGSSSVRRLVVPDARSDIYSVGATLYHLLSGKKPAKYAKDVEPLSSKEFNPQLVRIITKAMNIDPELRYHSADEMLREFKELWKNDPRTKRQKRNLIAEITVFSLLLVLEGGVVFTGLTQMERLQTARVMASESSEMLAEGNVRGAVDRAMDALVRSPGLFDIPYTAEAQLALTNALGVYDLADSFKPYSTIELPSAPFRVVQSPDGSRLAVCYAYEMSVYDIASGELIKSLPTLESAMCEVRFVNEDRLVFSGKDGIAMYDINADKVIWNGEQATAIALSDDKTVAAAINGKDDKITFYAADSGKVISVRELEGKHPDIPENDNYADACRSIFELNGSGSMCAVSLTEGYLGIIDVFDESGDLIIYDTSDYSYFNGKFLGDIFGFSASGKTGAVFGIVDWVNGQYIGDMQGNTPFKILTYDDKLYVSQNDTVVQMNTDDFSQSEAAYTENKNITALDVSDKYIISAFDGGYSIFSNGAYILQSEVCDATPDFVLINDKYAVIANRNSPTIEILGFKEHSAETLLNYDPGIIHSEARLLSDRSGAMLFSINNFTVLNSDGSIRKTVELSEPDKIYDQQYHHENDSLEVIYYSGKVITYSAMTGDIISETSIAPPDDSLDEEFETEDYIIKAPLHGVPSVYDKKTGEKTAELNSNDYLTYVTETENNIVAQYISTEGKAYGILMNKNCEPIARLPYLCDAADNMLVFDFPNGNIRITPVYELDELRKMAESN